jgi:hypothetical protein
LLQPILQGDEPELKRGSMPVAWRVFWQLYLSRWLMGACSVGRLGKSRYSGAVTPLPILLPEEIPEWSLVCAAPWIQGQIVLGTFQPVRQQP